MLRKLILLLVLCFIGWVVYSSFFRENEQGATADAVVMVPKGTSVSALADSLVAKGLIRSGWSFSLAARVLGVQSKLRPGAYRIAYGLTNVQIVKRFTGTEFYLVKQATFPEGITIYRAASIAKRKLELDSEQFISYAKDTALLREFGVPPEARDAEGYLFPDTYNFLFTADPKMLVTMMLKQWRSVITDSLMKEIARTGLTLHEFMTLASITEAEARRADERDTIAGLYWNRLRIGMKLDADPTVQYGLKLTRPITRAELQQNTPYNTYMNKGLPPGPINNPGKAAIIATLDPAKHAFLYFVTRKDGSGGHYFSRTLEEQTARIAEARRNQAAIASRDTSAGKAVKPN